MGAALADAVLPAPRRGGEAARWVTCFVVVAALHVAVALWLLAHAVRHTPNDTVQDAIQLDLPPLPATAGAPAASPAEAMDAPDDASQEATQTRDALAEDTPPEPTIELPQSVPDVNQTLTELMPKPPEPVLPAPPMVEPIEIKPPAVTPPPDAVILPAQGRRVETRPAPKPEVRPKPRPQPKPVPVVERPKPRPAVRRAERVDDENRPASRRASAGSAGARATEARTGAAESAADAAASLASWRARVAAHLARFKRYPGDAQARGERGTARVTFTMDRSGRVLSVRLSGSSGSAILDEASTDMVRRAQPLPAPPPEVRGGSFPFAVPVAYSTR